jgi:hypothetical protein
VDISKLSDLELAKLQRQVYIDLIQAQGNLAAINIELEKRTPKVEVKQEETTS